MGSAKKSPANKRWPAAADQEPQHAKRPASVTQDPTSMTRENPPTSREKREEERAAVSASIRSAGAVQRGHDAKKQPRRRGGLARDARGNCSAAEAAGRSEGEACRSQYKSHRCRRAYLSDPTATLPIRRLVLPIDRLPAKQIQRSTLTGRNRGSVNCSLTNHPVGARCINFILTDKRLNR